MLEARTPSARQLRDDRVDLWYAWTDAAGDAALLERYGRLLCDDERARRDRFVFDRDARLFTVAHALVRAVLSCYRDVDPRRWRFAAGSHGKPEIVEPAESELHFNLSHTRGLAACAVATRPLGVDVEWVARDTATREVAERSFASDELAQLEGLAGEAYRRRFFDFWTLKEALIKADGRGISMGLERFAFRLADPPTVVFDAELGCDPAGWWFRQDDPGPQHRAAVAVRDAGPFELRRFRTVPFA